MSRFCVVEGTKISLNDSESIPIERIKVGQEILTFDLNTLQKSQKYDILVKMKTNKFGGIFQEDLVKNVWKNNVDEYYLINGKLKITKDHIIMAKRDQTYYWTKVEKLLLNDYLFTELNIFERIESIIIVKEKVKVFNLEVNRVFNYFANSYLIHNGAPCSACLACGKTFSNFLFCPQLIASFDYTGSDTTNDNNWISLRSVSASYNSSAVVSDGSSWTDGDDQDDFAPLSDLITQIEASSSNESDWKYSRRVLLETADTDPTYSVRGVLPIINQGDEVKFYVKIKDIGTGGSSGSPNYNLWGIGIMRKFNSFEDSSDKNVDTGVNSWNTVSTNYAAPYALQPQDSGAGTSNSLIFGNTKIMIRVYGDTNLYIKDIEVPFYGTIAIMSTSGSGKTLATLITVSNFYGISTDISGTLNDDYNVIGGGLVNPTNITAASYSTGSYTITTAGDLTSTISVGDILGFTKMVTSANITTHSQYNNGAPSGMGYDYHKSYGTNNGGESQESGDFAPRGGGNDNITGLPGTRVSTLVTNSYLNDLIVVGGIVGFEITSETSVQPDRALSTGEKIRLMTFYGKTPSGNKLVLAAKELPELYFDKVKKLHLISSLNNDSFTDGPWTPMVFDSTTGTTNRNVTLEIINPI